jgi:hypothetical protein
MAQPHLPQQLHNTIFQITLPSNPPRVPEDQTFQNLANTVANLTTEVRQGRIETGQVRIYMGQMQTELGQMRTEIGQMRTEMDQMRTEMDQMQTEIDLNTSRDRVNANRDEHTLHWYFPGRLRGTRSASRANFGCDATVEGLLGMLFICASHAFETILQARLAIDFLRVVHASRMRLIC